MTVEVVLDVAAAIPVGRVASYGTVAAVTGLHPRQVGAIMREHGSTTCWWRVVRADGTSAVADRALTYWKDEGTELRNDAAVDMTTAAVSVDELVQWFAS